MHMLGIVLGKGNIKIGNSSLIKDIGVVGRHTREEIVIIH